MLISSGPPMELIGFLQRTGCPIGGEVDIL